MFDRFFQAITEDMTPRMKRCLFHWTAYILMCVFVLWALGEFPGAPGFALASDLEQIKQEISEERRALMAEIVAERRELTDAIKAIGSRLENVDDRMRSLEIGFLEELDASSP